jgi:DNA-binding transcriptional ArsR family regulator
MHNRTSRERESDNFDRSDSKDEETGKNVTEILPEIADVLFEGDEDIALSATQLECMGSPVRVEILTALRELEAASVNELAQYMGVSPKGLYHHLRQLQAVQLVAVREARKVGKRVENVYAPYSGPWEASLDMTEAEYRNHLVRSTSAMLRTVDREQQAATEALADHPELSHAMRFRRAILRLEPDKLARLMQLLEEVEKTVIQDHTPESGQRVSLLITVLPIVHRESSP